MSSFPVGPSTMDGIKRLAKAIKHERTIPHHVALDLAAQKAGYQNIRHAQDRLAAHTASLHTVYLTAYWATRGAAGRETLKVQLPKPLESFVARHQVGHARNLRFFRLESGDHLERSSDVDSQERAQLELFAAVRALRFMAATNLRPATTRKERRASRDLGDLPGSDHMSWWIHGETGAWVILDEPYAKSDLDGRANWATSHGLQMIVPRWEGLHNPGSAVPYIFCVDPVLATQLATELAQLQFGLTESTWDGESAPYYSQYVSPAREATGKQRRPRPMPSYRGVERAGALPYGSSSGGEVSSWRPAKRMALELHLTVGPLLHALDHHQFPGMQRKIIGRVRTTLDDWLQMEYPGDEMSAEQFHAAYYGVHREPIVVRDLQAAAIRHVADLLRQGYADCKPRQRMLKDLGAAGLALEKAKPH